MIRVLQIGNQLGLGGTERGILEIAREMTYGVFAHQVIGFMGGGERAEAIAGHVPVTIADGDTEIVRKALGERAVDVVILHRSGSSAPHWGRILRMCRDAGVKAILEFNIFGLIDRTDEDGLIDWHLHISKTSHLFAMREAARTGYARCKSHRVMHIPVNVSGFGAARFSAEDRLAARAEIGLHPADFVLLRTGRPDVRKWGDLLLYVVPEVAARIPEARFVFQSAPESRARFMRRSRFSGKVVLLPPTSDDLALAKTYSVADAYVHASRRGESLGVSLIEAASMELPAVVNATPWRDNAQVEVVDHMKTGIVANTAAAMAESIAYLYANPAVRLQMGRAAREKALRCYDSRVVCRSLAALIAETLQAKGAGAKLHAEGWGPVAPSMADLDEFREREYPDRSGSSWGGHAPRRPGTPLQRARWLVSDAAEIMVQRLWPHGVQ